MEVSKKIEVDGLDEMGGKILIELTPRNERFLQLYIFDGDLAGNGTLSYCEAYDHDPKVKAEKDVARNLASRLLKRPLIISRISFLITSSALSIEQAYRTLAWLSSQKSNLTVSLNATKEIIAERHRLSEYASSRKGKRSGKGKIIKQIHIRSIKGRDKDIDE